jgi:hypothetical protein
MQTVKKGVWLHPIGISHTTEHMYCSLIVLLAFSFFVPEIAVGGAVVFVTAVEGLIHYFVDFTKVKYGCKDNTKPVFWTQFGLDQLAHTLTYLWMVWYLLVL